MTPMKSSVSQELLAAMQQFQNADAHLAPNRRMPHR